MTIDGDANGDGSSNSSSSSASSVDPLSPKSPPRSLDLYGKRRQIVKFQVLEREIGLLQEEIKFIESLQPASRSCKELDEFVVAKQDPFLATNQEIRKSHYLKRLWRRCCFCLSWTYCSSFSCCCCCCFKKTKCCACFGLPGCCFRPNCCKCTKVNLCCICVKPCCL